MADNIRRPARARMWKRIAIALGSVSTVALVVFVILAFLPQGNAAFTIRIDNPYEKDESESHFHMATYEEQGKEEELQPTQPVLRDAPLDHMVPTTAQLVEEYLKEQNDASKGNKLNKSQNYATYKDANKTEVDRGLAQVYTIYLVNESKTDEQKLKYTVQTDSYARTDTNDILNYFRILIQTELVGENNLHNDYYGQKHNNPQTPFPEYKTGAEDGLCEPISTYQRSWSSDSEKVINALFETNVREEGGKVVGDGYCKNFLELDETNKALVNAVDIVIPAGKTLRFTYAAFFEGEDMDCRGSIPADSYLLLSLHFGV